MNVAALSDIEPEPIAIDPRPCGLCGRTIDQHERIDTPEGPEFFCYPADDIVTCWELADPRDAWRHTGEAPPPENFRNSDIQGAAGKPPQYRTPQSVVDAFWYVVQTQDPASIGAWLADHPSDKTYLRKILEQKCLTAAL
jgi:hypothetical protein